MTPNRFLVLKIVLLFLFWSSTAVKIKDRRFYDKEGREIVFHGPNIVVKVPPYMPKTDSFSIINSFSEEDMQNLKNWGFNGIRLGVMYSFILQRWAGVEPDKDTYNETYLSEMVELVNKAGQKYGIYTMIEFHQDIIAQKYCGDGIPTWLIDEIHGYKTFPMPITKKPMKLNASGLPNYDDCTKNNWAFYYFSDDVGRTFNQLYDHKHRLNQKFTAYWRKIATSFKGNPWVIAYQIINEPWIGDFVRNPSLIVPSVAERVKFMSFYDRISQSIRQIDPDTPICIQPVTFDLYVPTGFSHAPGGNRFANNSILCYHNYVPGKVNVGTMKARIKDSQRLNIAALLSEFEAGHYEIIQIAEQNFQSWFFWDFKNFGKLWGHSSQLFPSQKSHKPLNVGTIYNPDGTIDIQTLAYTSRTYIQKTAGKLIKTSFDSQTKHFNIVYDAVPSGKSIIYLNKQLNYPKGYLIDAKPAKQLTYFEKQNYIQIQFKGNENKLVMVTIDAL